jgi:hypothetical protein
LASDFDAGLSLVHKINSNKMKKYIIWLLCLCFAVGLQAQKEKKKITIGIIDFKLPSRAEINKNGLLAIYGDQSDLNKVALRIEALQSIVSECYVKDNRFDLVDRRATEAISKERELQKTEDFMEGYVVGQGKSIGADYLLFGNYDLKTSRLVLSLFSIEEGKIVAKESDELKSGFFGNKDIVEPTQLIVQRLNGRVFPLLIPIVEVTEQSKSKVKLMLIAGGLNRGLKEDMKLDIKIKDEIEVEGEKQTYFKTVGIAQVDKVEDANFTVVKVTENGDIVKQLLDSGKKLYCTFQNTK